MQTEREMMCEASMPLVYHVIGVLRVYVPRVFGPEDLEAAGICGLLKAIDSYDEKRAPAFSTWAVFCIRRAILDEVRSLGGRDKGQQRNPKQAFSIPSDYDACSDDHSDREPAAQAERQDVIEFVRRAVAALPVRQRKLLQARYWQKKPYKKMDLGVCENTLYETHRVALETLRDRLEPELSTS